MLRQAHRRNGVLWLSLLLLVLTLAFSGAANATVWQTGDVITYDQGAWGDSSSPAGVTLTANYNALYSSTFDDLVVGVGFQLTFTSSQAVLAYLPQLGPVGSALTSSLDNPTSTASGAFGGDVVALRLNVDFSAAGFIAGTSNLAFGDLTLHGYGALPAFNNQTVSQIESTLEAVLGGANTSYDITASDTLAQNLNAAFAGGSPSLFAQDHLNAPAAAVPEPSTMLLLGSGLIGLAGLRRRLRE